MGISSNGGCCLSVLKVGLQRPGRHEGAPALGASWGTTTLPSHVLLLTVLLTTPPTPHSCRAPVTKLERIPGEAGLFISPLTLQGFRSQADLARHAQQLQGTLAALLAAGAGAAIALPGGPGGMQAAGWKPPPPPGPPPPGTGIAGSGGSGYGRRQQYGVQPSRQGMGAVMRPR